jgi:hemoglobin/transferrin/lactoferrin receptor protein
VVRGPVANVYGSGAIGGVASFRTKDLSDIILPGEMAAVQSHGMFGTNGSQWLGSTFMGARGPAGDVFAGGVYRNSQDYVEGNGEVVPNTGSQLESGLVKIATRPAEGQEIKLSAITYNTNYDFGQTSGSEGVYATNVQNQTVTGQYTLKSPETPLVDFHTDSIGTRPLHDRPSRRRSSSAADRDATSISPVRSAPRAASCSIPAASMPSTPRASMPVHSAIR